MKKAIKEFLTVKGNSTRIVLFLIFSTLYQLVEIRRINLVENVFGAAKDHDTKQIVVWSVITMIALLSTVLSSYLTAILQNHIKYDTQAQCTDKFAKKLLTLDYAHFADIGQGHAFTVLGKSSAAGRLTFILLQVLSMVPGFVIGMVSIFSISRKLGVTVAAIAVCMMCAVYTTFRQLDKLSDAVIKVETTINHEFSEIIGGFMEIRGNATESFHANNMRNNRRNMTTVVHAINRKGASVDAYCEFITSLITWTICGVTAIMVYQERLTVTTAVAAIYYGWKLTYPIVNGSGYVANMVPLLADYKMYDEYMSVENKVFDGDVEICDFDHDIKFNDVSFSYKGKDDTSIKNVTVTIPKNKHIGICGKTGCGKSTFIKLIERFYDPQEGSITIDDHDIRDYSLCSLRNMMGIVNQETHIFNGTILDNIKYGSTNPTPAEIDEVLDKAQLRDLINRLPDGLRTVVGENGMKLSGGERQRIALARVFLRNPQIIILDEATSALDNNTEAFVKKAVDSMKGKTVITIAHRLTTIKDCDEILVFDNGHIVDTGSHEELMESSEIYQKLCKISEANSMGGDE